MVYSNKVTLLLDLKPIMYTFSRCMSVTLVPVALQCAVGVAVMYFVLWGRCIFLATKLFLGRFACFRGRRQGIMRSDLIILGASKHFRSCSDLI